MARLRYFARETLVSLRRNLLMTLAGTLTVMVSLALAGGVLLLSRWVNNGTDVIKGGVRLEIFMNIEASSQQNDDLQALLEDDRQVRSFRFIDKQAAYREAQRIFRDDPELLSSIEPKDLPTSFRVAPVRAEQTEDMKARYENEAGVDKVITPDDALRGLLDATSRAKLIFFGLSIALVVSSLFLIVNTIRLATFARRREIEVMKLVGASNWFVRVPFMAEALVQGLIGAGLAVGALMVLKTFGFDSWSHGEFFQRFFVTTGDAMGISVILLALGILIGLIGSLVGLRRFLRV